MEILKKRFTMSKKEKLEKFEKELKEISGSKDTSEK